MYEIQGIRIFGGYAFGKIYVRSSDEKLIPSMFSNSDSVILLSQRILPGELVAIKGTKVQAICTKYGSDNSHASIIARSMGIPAMIGVDFDEAMHGKYAIVDSYASKLILEPDDEVLNKYKEKAKIDVERRLMLSELIGKDNITIDGHSIDIFANIGGVSDLEYVMQNDAGGIGLFRTEFLYINAKSYPSEEEQFEAYKTVASQMGGKRVIIRTLDIGADKKAAYFNLEPETNPQLGFRAIRICLEDQEVLRTQMRAILRASAYGNVSIMYPMISSIWEVTTLKDILRDVMFELDEEEIAYKKDILQGIMIETPAAVLLSEELAQEVDFFSIGTNDLTQYILACDRQNPRLEKYSDPHHPAVLRAIRQTVESAHRYNIRVGICGELAADILMTEFFLRLGVDELSVTASRVLDVRDAVRKINLEG